MAGGRGERLRPITDKVPKPLLRLGARTVIERIIAQLAAGGVREVFVSVNYKADAFEERLGDGASLGVRLSYLHEEERLGTAGSLTLLPRPVAVPILVTNADILTRMDFARLFAAHAGGDASITIVAIEHQAKIPYAVLRAEDGVVTAIEEKPSQGVLVNGGIYCLEPEVLDLLAPKAAIDMPDVIQRAMAEGMRVRAFPTADKWFDIGSPEDFERVLLEFATGEEE